MAIPSRTTGRLLVNSSIRPPLHVSAADRNNPHSQRLPVPALSPGILRVFRGTY